MPSWLLLEGETSQAYALEVNDVAGDMMEAMGFACQILPKPLSTALVDSAQRAGNAVHALLRLEERVPPFISLDYEFIGEARSAVKHLAVSGKSADLAFAVATVQGFADYFPENIALRREIAATGVLDADYQIRRVKYITSKLHAALACLPANSWVFYPKENDAEIPASLRAQADQQAIQLYPVSRLDEMLEHLGIALNHIYLKEPFRGLQAFTYAHRSIYFGRQADSFAVRERLLQREQLGCPSLLILGGSGSGKSSLVQAGIMPSLIEPLFIATHPSLQERPIRWSLWRPRDWHAIPPGEAHYCQELAKIWATELGVPDLDAPSDYAALIAAWQQHWPSSHRFVWVLDQLEELFTLNWSPDFLAPFCQFLSQLQQQGVWLIATLRSDFYAAYQQSPLQPLFDGGHYDLKPLNPEALRQVIEQPVLRAGLRFETDPRTGISLADQLLHDMQGQAHALPLLEYTLSQLHAAAQAESSTCLSFKAYQALGDAEQPNKLLAAIGKKADDALADFSQQHQLDMASSEQLLSRILFQLAAVSHEDRFTAQPCARQRFHPDSLEGLLLQHLIEARLLVADSDTTIRIAHEALFNHWPRAKQQLAQLRQDLQKRAELEQAAARWQHSERSEKDKRSLLLNAGLPLAEAEDFLQWHENSVSPTIRKFVEASGLYHKRQKKKRRITVISLIFVFVMTGVWYWDYSKIKIEYFEELDYKFGSPIGINKLNESQLMHRSHVYKFESQYGLVRQVTLQNGYGYPIEDEDGFSKWTYAYLDNKIINKVSFFSNDKETPVKIHVYEWVNKNKVSIRRQNRDGFVLLEEIKSLPSQNFYERYHGKSHINIYQQEFGEDGEVIKETYFNAFGTPMESSQGYYGVEYNMLSNKIKEKKYFNKIGYIYIEKEIKTDQVKWVCNYNQNNLPLLVHGYHCQKTVYDIYNNIIEQSYYGIDSQPLDNEETLYHKIQYHYNNGLRTLIVLYSAADSIIYQIKIGYDQQGRERERNYLDKNQNLLITSDGYSSMITHLTEKGTLIEYFDSAGNRVLNKREGCHRTLNKRDGDALEHYCFDQNLNPSLDSTGCYVRYKSQNEAACFGINKEKINNLLGFHKVEFQADEKGNLTSISFYDHETKKIDALGFHKTLIEYDGHGRIMHLTMFSSMDKVISNVSFDHDTRLMNQQINIIGDVIDRSFYLQFAEALKKTFSLPLDINSIKGVVTYATFMGKKSIYFDFKKNQVVFDHESEHVCSWFFGENYDKPENNFQNPEVVGYILFMNKDDIPLFLFFLDVTKISSLTQVRGLFVSKNGIFAKFIDYQSNYVKRIYSLGENELIKSNPFWAHLVCDGKYILSGFYDENGFPALSNKKFHIVKKQYDKQGNVIEVAYFGLDNKPIIYHDKGYHRLARRYDARGNTIEWSYFGPDNQPILFKERYHRSAYRYDEKGNVIEVAYFGLDNQPIIHHDEGYHRLTRRYDAQGNEIENAFWGTDGQPIALYSGYHRRNSRYDEQGNEVEIAYYDVNGQLTPRKVTLEAGQYTAKSFHRFGVAKAQYTYNADHQLQSALFFTAEGVPGENAQGVMAMYTDKNGEIQCLNKAHQIISCIPNQLPSELKPLP